MTDDFIKKLIAAGLSKQQASSVTAETLVQLFMQEDGRILIKEAQTQVSEMRGMVNNLRSEYQVLKEKICVFSETLNSIAEAQKEYGTITDEKAKNVVALYASLLSMNEKAGAESTDAVRSASYIVYAYLGGQAKREIQYVNE